MIRSRTMYYRLAAFDNDGTLHPAKGVWSYLQKPLDLWEGEGRELLMTHLAGEMGYTEMVTRTIARWAGRPERDFLAVLESMPLRPHVLECLAACRSAGMKVVVFSSGLQWWEAIWKTQYHQVFDNYRANGVVVDAAGIVTGQVTIVVTDDAPTTNKGHHLAQVQDQWRIARAETLAFGDGTGDIPLFEQAGLGFCLDPTNDRVRDAARGGELTTGDWRELRERLPELAAYWPERSGT